MPNSRFNSKAISPTTLYILLECPKCFWLKVKLRFLRPEKPVASITNGLDRVFKQYFDIYRENKSLPPILDGQIKGRLIDILPKAYYYSDNDSGLLFWGKLDEVIDFEDGTFAAFDHKTRGSKAPAVHPAHQLQMDSYNLLLEENARPTKSKAYLAYWIPTGGELHSGVPFNVELKEITTNSERVRDLLLKAAMILENSNPPKAATDCIFCSWAQNLPRS